MDRCSAIMERYCASFCAYGIRIWKAQKDRIHTLTWRRSSTAATSVENVDDGGMDSGGESSRDDRGDDQAIQDGGRGELRGKCGLKKFSYRTVRGIYIPHTLSVRPSGIFGGTEMYNCLRQVVSVRPKNFSRAVRGHKIDRSE